MNFKYIVNFSHENEKPCDFYMYTHSYQKDGW